MHSATAFRPKRRFSYLRLDVENDGVALDPVRLLGFGGLGSLERGHHCVEVRNVHRQRDLLWVLWVGVRLDVGDPERPKKILAGGLASGEPALGVLHLVMNDDLRHVDPLLVARPKVIRRDWFGTYPTW